MSADPGISISDAIRWAVHSLQDGESPAVDARVLVCHVLDCQQSYLYTWPEKLLSLAQHAALVRLVEQRQQGIPVAYLTGKRQFWDLLLQCNATTLIPRPETESLVEAALALEIPANARVCDLGTGTGAIALALAYERPGWKITGVDRIADAISLAKSNALLNHIDGVEWQVSHWFSALPSDVRYDLIVTNPPYVESDSPYLRRGDVRFEPHSALTAGDDGLDDIRHIVAESPERLAQCGWLLIEHGHTQHQAVKSLMQQRGFSGCKAIQDLNGHNRITLGQWIE
ncbi:peptide chain release factor N(5)-glutamine methyltransferase [Aestuariibacter sp. GS-14]|uniref:peptide chain release factor N(5)-glutamine methyltransferase n=1 Tax=Aestuariibacter sp. GS-14 TaxID=2590670 RepID=UPI00112BCE37|nr:peptide chain release factor N(5)-glutamine methyltransferase [Aestuariibacter sp. GS-14]TPV60657.1 peptide chain release factor N(5)-glutamine methyltransferase [Aestuariibacter sp. GS-14]